MKKFSHCTFDCSDDHLQENCSTRRPPYYCRRVNIPVGRHGVEKSLDDGSEGSWGGVVDDEGLNHGGDSGGIEGLEKGVCDELLSDDLGKMMVVIWGRRRVDRSGRGRL